MIEQIRLTAWLSPTYPVGAYAYSHGLEWAVEAGHVADEAGIAGWLGDVMALGAGRNDLILAAQAHRAASARAVADLVAINDLALALAPSRELHLETSQQGRSFLDATLAAWPCPPLDAVAEALPGPVAYPVAVGAAAAAHRTERPALSGRLRPRLRPEPRLGGVARRADRPGRGHPDHRRPEPPHRRPRRGGGGLRPRRSRLGDAAGRSRLVPARDPVFADLPLVRLRRSLPA